MKLKKMIYGLPQSPKNWFGNMDDHISNSGFHSLESDPCVYAFKNKPGFAILTHYLDVNQSLSHPAEYIPLTVHKAPELPKLQAASYVEVRYTWPLELARETELR